MSDKIIVRTFEFTEEQLAAYEKKIAVKTVTNTLVTCLALVGLVTVVGLVKERIENKENDD